MSGKCLRLQITSSTTGVDGVAGNPPRHRPESSAVSRLVVLCLTLAALVGGCGTPGPVPLALPHHNFPAIAVTGVATGGVIRFDGRCVWLESESGTSNLIWPTSYRAVAPPLAIFGASGRVIVGDGDRVELGVGDAKEGVPGCPARGGFYVGEVSRVNGLPWPDGEAPRPPIDSRPVR
jgi:hypothetical protein